MADFIARMFTPSNSDGSGQVAPAKRTPGAPQAAAAKGKPKKKTQTRYGGASSALATAKAEADTARKTLLGQ